MRFQVGDLVVMDREVAKNHINHGGYSDYIFKVGIVVRIAPRSKYQQETIIVKFPCGEPPEEWLGSDFEWLGTEK